MSFRSASTSSPTTRADGAFTARPTTASALMATLPRTQPAKAEVPHTRTPSGAQAGELTEADAPNGANVSDGGRQKALTIGAVCKALVQEFPDISISKIRYLEDQKLLTPRRTPGGYRLYTQSDVARLRTILRMQRDEFLPLRVIRQELAAGRADDMQVPRPGREGGKRAWHTSVSVRDQDGALYSLEDVLEETSADAKLVSELEEYGVVKGEMRGGVRYFDETEREIISAVSELARYGVGGRNLRVFRSSADREANLLQQILAPALRSRNPQRRKDAVEALENLAAVTTHLKHLLLVRDLRKIVR
jgi:DNA-binding transcriptional MerR regulator